MILTMGSTRPGLEAVRQKVRDLAADHTRILLVLLGVAWGTLSLTTVLAFGEEFSRSFERALRGSTRDILRFWSGATLGWGSASCSTRWPITGGSRRLGKEIRRSTIVLRTSASR